MTIFILKDGNRVGPFTIEQVSGLIQEGEASMTDLAWSEGFTEWKPIHALPEIASMVLPPIPNSAPTTEQNTGSEQQAMELNQVDSEKLRLPAFLFCLIFGYVGSHAFYAGRNKQGMLYLCLFVVGFFSTIAGISTPASVPSLVGAVIFIIIIGLVLINAFCVASGHYRDHQGRQIRTWVNKSYPFPELIFKCALGAPLWLLLIWTVARIIGELHRGS